MLTQNAVILLCPGDNESYQIVAPLCEFRACRSLKLVEFIATEVHRLGLLINSTSTDVTIQLVTDEFCINSSAEDLTGVVGPRPAPTVSGYCSRTAVRDGLTLEGLLAKEAAG